MSIVIRKAGKHDCRVAAELLYAFNTEFQTPTPSPEDLEVTVSRCVDRDEFFILLAGEPPVGIAVVSLRPSVWYEGPIAMLDELYVVPSFRNGGIGGLLIDAVIRSLKQVGCEELQISVDGDDFDAQRFYERQHFEKQERGQSRPAMFYFREL